MILNSPLAAAAVLPTEVIYHGANPKSETLEDHVAVKKLFWRVMEIAVEDVVIPTG